ncbi:hypothetical protein V6B16_14815 [Salinimicrobium catena]|uniref:hypothetical protein n=1 Tax=Salinimicrobium catena TaxID=390640 RepID=UPI002FE47FA2
MSNYRLILGIIGVLVLIIFWSSIESKTDCESFISGIKSEKYNGIVTEKYIDSINHMYKKVILKNSSKTNIILLDDEKSGLFRYLKNGDSIFKKNNSLKVHIKRNTSDTIFNLDYYCLTEINDK